MLLVVTWVKDKEAAMVNTYNSRDWDVYVQLFQPGNVTSN